jgi:beta-1,4-N-acetylglucosaminyltransferase
LILVTVGTHNQGFDRLVQPMDELAAELGEQVVIQRGSSTYEPQYAEHFQWTTSQRMEQLTQDARIVVTHAAAGAIILALRYGKPLLVVPRLRRFDEHTDDHQRQLAMALDAEGKAVVVPDPSVVVLRAAIDQAARQERATCNGSAHLAAALRRQLQQWSP